LVYKTNSFVKTLLMTDKEIQDYTNTGTSIDDVFVNQSFLF